MNRHTYKLDDYDLSASGVTKPVSLSGKGPVSIQPVVRSLQGSPTYTLQVSNDGKSFVDYDKLSTQVSIDAPIQINYEAIPWEYLRFNVSSAKENSGTVQFMVYQYE